jgi:DNA-binding XRE family transcriptional regulator
MPKSKEAHVLVRLRRHLSLSQEQLAEWCDCSYYTIQAVELGRLKLSNSLAERISMATGAPVKWLLENNLSAPLPKLIWKPSEPAAFNTSYIARAMLFMAVARALRALKSDQATQIVVYHSLEFLKKLNLAFGEIETVQSQEEMADYVQAELDSWRNPTADEKKFAAEFYGELFNEVALNSASFNAVAEVSKRKEKKGKKQSARPQKKAPRRIRQSA